MKFSYKKHSYISNRYHKINPIYFYFILFLILFLFNNSINSNKNEKINQKTGDQLMGSLSDVFNENIKQSVSKKDLEQKNTQLSALMSEVMKDSIKEIDDYPDDIYKDESDMDMMIRILNSLPDVEKESIGLNELNVKYPERNEEKEEKIREIWNERQRILAKAMEKALNPPSVLDNIIKKLRYNMKSPESKYLFIEFDENNKDKDNNDNDEENNDNNIILNDDEIYNLWMKLVDDYLGDIDMSRDFDTLGGVQLFFEYLNPIYYSPKIRKATAWAFGLAIGHMEEFQIWSLRDMTMNYPDEYIFNDFNINDTFVNIDDELNVDDLMPLSDDPKYDSCILERLTYTLPQSQQKTKLRLGNLLYDDLYISNESIELSKRILFALSSSLSWNPSVQHSFLNIKGYEYLSDSARLRYSRIKENMNLSNELKENIKENMENLKLENNNNNNIENDDEDEDDSIIFNFDDIEDDHIKDAILKKIHNIIHDLMEESQIIMSSMTGVDPNDPSLLIPEENQDDFKFKLEFLNKHYTRQLDVLRRIKLSTRDILS